MIAGLIFRASTGGEITKRDEIESMMRERPFWETNEQEEEGTGD